MECSKGGYCVIVGRVCVRCGADYRTIHYHPAAGCGCLCGMCAAGHHDKCWGRGPH